MDPFAVGCSFVGFAIGWGVKGLYPDRAAVVPCSCDCHCQHSVIDSSSNWGQSGIFLAILVGILGLLANAALAFKVTVVSKGPGKEVAFSVKGKSKGIYNPSRGLEITG